jgi:ubiquinone/menaquinone biosynthesis C-methylase UbiE
VGKFSSSKKKMIHSFIEKLSQNPRIFILLRRILENNFKSQKKVIKEQFIIAGNDQVLDLGCGTGEFSTFIPPQQYTGLDIDKKYIDFATKNYKRKFLVGDARKLPFADKTFSKIMVIGVFHHMSDELSSAVLSEVKRVLKDDGEFLFMEDLESPDDTFFTKRLHKLDKGEHIRSTEQYIELVEPFFSIKSADKIRSGLLPYQVLILKKL